jgi:uncharacterized protein DUF1990
MTDDLVLLEAAEGAKTTWNRERGGAKTWVWFEDLKIVDLGPDSEEAFEAISGQMVTGHYYPPDAVIFFGRHQMEGRDMRPGDTILQTARVVPFLPWPTLHSVARIDICDRLADSCTIGYVTTDKHLGKGVWKATLRREDGRLTLTVESSSGPGSFWFWIGLPYARFLQLRARRRGIGQCAALAQMQ